MIRLGLAAALITSGSAAAQNASAPAPFDIGADHLEVLQGRNTALFTGNVVIVRAGATLKADVLRAVFQDDEAQSSQRIRTMEAEGDVSYDTGEERVTGRRARYEAAGETITFEEDVTVVRGRDVLTGCKLVYFLKKQESRLEACPDADAPTGRVRGMFFPDADAPAPEDADIPTEDDDEDGGEDGDGR